MSFSEKRVLEIQIPDSANFGPFRTARVTVEVYNRGSTSFGSGVYTKRRPNDREDDIALESGAFETLISDIRHAIKIAGYNQGWLDRDAEVRMPHDEY